MRCGEASSILAIEKPTVLHCTALNHSVSSARVLLQSPERCEHKQNKKTKKKLQLRSQLSPQRIPTENPDRNDHIPKTTNQELTRAITAPVHILRYYTYNILCRTWGTEMKKCRRRSHSLRGCGECAEKRAKPMHDASKTKLEQDTPQWIQNMEQGKNIGRLHLILV